MKLLVPLAVALGLVASACGSSGSSKRDTTTTTTTPKVTGSVTVSAAASLTQAFGKIGADFKKANPATTVTFNFGPSSTLETQIAQGAPADVFASADQANMDKLSTAGLLDGPSTVFAKNSLVIVTKPGNPKKVKTLADLATVGTVSLCAVEVPCGKYAAQALQTAGVTIPESSVTRGADVKATIGAVTTGDADAAIVYVTDAKTAGSTVESVPIPDAQNVIAVYPIAVLTANTNPSASTAFVDYVESSKGQATLASFGFLPPS
jgi:molybdate transport system substrate-binding protein